MVRIRIESCGRTDAGLRRSSSEDAFVPALELGLPYMADGMGGEAYGVITAQAGRGDAVPACALRSMRGYVT
jgi:serine/threonine protein phosphatase PrpC